jgi:hypothetical protein
MATYSRGRVPDSTGDLPVPNLGRVVERLRDQSLNGCVTIVHAPRDGEGEWALSLVSARLSRRGLKVAGPEPTRVMDMIEFGARIGAKVIFAGELRRAEDGKALRAAAKLGIKVVGVVTHDQLSEAQIVVKALGPWDGCNVEFFSIAPERPSAAHFRSA